jgi:PncC family amidohydrolase
MILVKEIGENLKKSKCRISTAESCTSGYISNLLTSQKGSSDYFEGALVVYSNSAKINVLGVEKELIDEHTEVSEPVARRMAERVKEVMGTEYSIATTGYADATGYGTKNNPPGTIYIAVSSPQGTIVERINVSDGRGRNIYLATIKSLEILESMVKSHQALSL